MSHQPYFSSSRYKVSTLILVTSLVAVTVGIITGFLLSNIQSPVSVQLTKAGKNAEKFKTVLNYIDRYYVDSVNIDTLTDIAIVEMLKKLDPHTIFIPAKESEIVNSHLEDGFDGVGIEFHIFQDTVRIVGLIKDAPAMKAGLKVGDRILEVDGQSVVGIKHRGNNLLSMLRGKKGTSVKVKILRLPQKELFFTLVRDKIPTQSIETAFMVDDSTGYLKIERFGETVHDEFRFKVISLKGQGMTRLIIDLRNNGGGFLKQAVDVVDEMLVENKTIVYTDGRYDKFDSRDISQEDGCFEQGAVVVIINEHSASASEILAGALQDHDRAVIVGQRSFGKGLVQRQIKLPDKSLLRLTISRYYTPSGRSIQKPFAQYDHEVVHRHYKDDFFHLDSSHFQNLRHKTAKGRTVYGGGGITPDYFVAYDTSYYNGFYEELLRKDLIRDFAVDYAVKNEETLRELGLERFAKEFEAKNDILNVFLSYVLERKLKFTPADWKECESKIKSELKEDIARTLWGNEGYYKVFLQEDDFFKKALSVMPEAEKMCLDKTTQ